MYNEIVPYFYFTLNVTIFKPNWPLLTCRETVAGNINQCFGHHGHLSHGDLSCRADIGVIHALVQHHGSRAHLQGHRLGGGFGVGLLHGHAVVGGTYGQFEHGILGHFRGGGGRDATQLGISRQNVTEHIADGCSLKGVAIPCHQFYTSVSFVSCSGTQNKKMSLQCFTSLYLSIQIITKSSHIQREKNILQ